MTQSELMSNHKKYRIKYYTITILMANQQKEQHKDECNACVYNMSMTCNNDFQQKIPIKQTRDADTIKDKNFGYYQTGLIEGDGYISITKQDKNKIILGITFNIKDKPLANFIQKKIGKGFIVKRKTNSIELRFGAIKTIKRIIDLINGKFRTPKIDQFNIQVDWMNKNYSYNITKLPLDNTKIEDNSWQAGFIDADGGFYIKYTPKQIQCKFSLEQRMIYPKTQESYKPILSKICKSFDVNLKIRTRQNQKNCYYIIKIENQKSVQLLIDYLDNYPLFSSKYLDYKEWKNTHKQIIDKIHLIDKGKSIIKISKKSMNDNRTNFNWDHLKNIL